MIIWHTTLLHQLKTQLDKSHLHAKIIFVPYQENKNIRHCATLLNYFPTISTFPLKNTSYLEFGLQHHYPGIFIFQGIRSRENTEKYRSQWARFVCMQDHSSGTTDCMQINFIGRTSSVRRKNWYGSTVFSTIAHNASSSQCFYWIFVLPLSKITQFYSTFATKHFSSWPLFVSPILFS